MESDFPKAVQMNSLNSTHLVFCLSPHPSFPSSFWGVKIPEMWVSTAIWSLRSLLQTIKSGDKCKTCHWNATSLVVKIFMVLFIKMLKTESFQLALHTGNNLIANSFSPKAAGTCLSHGSWWEKPDPSSTVNIFWFFLIKLLCKLLKPNEAVKTRSDQGKSAGNKVAGLCKSAC